MFKSVLLRKKMDSPRNFIEEGVTMIKKGHFRMHEIGDLPNFSVILVKFLGILKIPHD